MKFLTSQDWEALLTRLCMNKSKINSANQNKESSISEKIEKIFLDVSQIIGDICFSKKLSHAIYGISMTFFHYYICFNDFRRIDKIELAFACFYMSSKVQFLNFPLKELIANYKEYIKNKPNYEKKTEPDFIKYEIQLYSLLGYDLDIETPYQMYYNSLQIFFEKFPNLKNLEKIEKIKGFCFNLINDTYTRPLSIYYHPKIIYLSCLIFTIKFLDINECNVDKIVEGENLDLISECMENIYDIYSKYVENN